MSAVSGFWLDVGSKLWNIGKRLIPAFAIFEFFRRLIGDWWVAKVAEVKAELTEFIDEISVDLALPQYYLAEINSVVPLEEFVQYLGLYFGLVLIVTGTKWLRNFIPGMS